MLKRILFISILLFFSFAFPCYALNLDDLKVHLLDGDYKQAVIEGEKILASQPQAARSDEFYCLLGSAYLKDGNLLRASDIFEIILHEFKDSKFQDEARLGLGDTYFLRGDFVKAEECYQELLKANPGTRLKAQALYRLSQVGFKKGDTEEGRLYLEKLRQEFPLNLESRLNQDLCVLPRASSEVYYTVQVGVFSNITNARNLVQKLTQANYAAYIEEAKSETGLLYRVRIGKLRLRQEARDLEKKLAGEGYPTKICP